MLGSSPSWLGREAGDCGSNVGPRAHQGFHFGSYGGTDCFNQPRVEVFGANQELLPIIDFEIGRMDRYMLSKKQRGMDYGKKEEKLRPLPSFTSHDQKQGQGLCWG